MILFCHINTQTINLSKQIFGLWTVVNKGSEIQLHSLMPFNVSHTLEQNPLGLLNIDLRLIGCLSQSAGQNLPKQFNFWSKFGLAILNSGWFLLESFRVLMEYIFVIFKTYHNERHVLEMILSSLSHPTLAKGGVFYFKNMF